MCEYCLPSFIVMHPCRYYRLCMYDVCMSYAQIYVIIYEGMYLYVCIHMICGSVDTYILMYTCIYACM